MTTAPSTLLHHSAAPGPAPRPALPALLGLVLRAAEQHVLVVVGEADLATAEQLRQHVITALAGQPPALLVELGALDFCDLTGLDALHDGARLAQAAGVPLHFRGMSRQLARLHAAYPQPPGPAGRGRTPAQRSPSAPRAQAGRTDRGPDGPESPLTPAGPARLYPLRRAGQPPTLLLLGTPSPAVQPAAHGRHAAPGGTLLTAREAGRTGRLVHAVPSCDTTRSALCGTRVRRAGTSEGWDAGHPDACADCTATMAAHATHDTGSTSRSAAATPHHDGSTTPTPDHGGAWRNHGDPAA